MRIGLGRGLRQWRTRPDIIAGGTDFAGASWTKNLSTATAAAADGPRGTATMTKLVANNASALNGSYVYQNLAKPAVATTYEWQLTAKAAELNRVTMSLREQANNANRASVTVSLTNGSIATAAAAIGTFTNASVIVTDMGGGAYRIALTFTTGTETSIRPQIFSADSVVVTGDGVSGIYIDNARLV